MKFKDFWWLKLIALALILRVILASFLYHTDLKGIYHESLLVKTFGWVGGYEKGVEENAPLHYPPPIYLLFSSYQTLAKPLFSAYFDKWMNDGGSQSIKNHPAIFRDLLVMKLPIIATDLLIAWLILKLVPEGRKKFAAALWLFNPFSLYAIYAFSHFDIIPTALILAAVVFFYRERKTLSYVSLGLAVGFKVFPLLLLPFWMFFDERSWIERIRDAALAVVVFTACLLPIISSKAAISSVFLSNLTGGITRASLDIGGHEELPLFPIVYSLFLIASASGLAKKIPLEAVPVAVFGTLLGLSNFHPQWMIWIMPFLALLIVKGVVKLQEALFMMLAYVGVVLLIDDIYMSLGLFKALNDASDSLPALRWWADRISVGSQLQGFFHAFFLAMVIWTIYRSFKGKDLSFKGKNLLPLQAESPGLAKISLLWGAALIGIFILIHIPLTIKGKYVDSEYTSQDGTIPLTSSTVIDQRFSIIHSNFSGISLRMKNVNLINKSDVFFAFTDQGNDGQTIYKINGGAIGDDYDLKINFKPINDSEDHTYLLTISSPQSPAATSGIIFVPYDSAAGTAGLTVGGKSVPGRLVFATYYNPGGLADNLKYTLSNITSKI